MKRKPVLLLSALMMLSGVFFTSCNKDELSQEEIIKQQQIIDFVVRVYDGSTAVQQPIDSAMVTIINGGEKMEAATGEDGLAIFQDVAIGDNVPVLVTKSDYTSIYTTYNLNPDDYRQTVENLSLPIYSFSKGEFVTIRGRLTAELDVTNREREAVPQGTLVKARQNGLPYQYQTAFVDSTDVDGYYEIKVPSREGYSNDDIEITYVDFVADQTIAMEDEDNKGVYEVVQRPTLYRFDNNSGYSGEIVAVPSVWATIAAPPAGSMGNGLEIIAVIEPTSLNYSEFQITKRGSGYDDGWQEFSFSNDDKDSAAFIEIWVENGKLTDNWDITNNLAGYTSAPTINLNANGGSGGEIQIFFRAAYKLIVTNKGSNYRKMPKVAVDVTDVMWSSEKNAWVDQSYSDDNINDGIDEVLNNDDILSDYAGIRNGSISPYDGDTLTIVGYFTSAPVFEVFEEEAKAAMIEIEMGDIDANDSTLTNITINESGSGYDPLNPPAVTLNVLAGYGSGARVKAEVDANGEVSNIEIIDEGDGYVKNVNDFRGNGTTSNSYEGIDFPGNWIYNITTGNIYIKDLYYGTGDPIEE